MNMKGRKANYEVNLVKYDVMLVTIIRSLNAFHPKVRDISLRFQKLGGKVTNAPPCKLNEDNAERLPKHDGTAVIGLYVFSLDCEFKCELSDHQTIMS